MKIFDKSKYTISDSAKAVRVAEFRDRIDQLMRVVCVDARSCVGKNELLQCMNTLTSFGSELIETSCSRATERDWNRREKAIEASFSTISELRDRKQ